MHGLARFFVALIACATLAPVVAASALADEWVVVVGYGEQREHAAKARKDAYRLVAALERKGLPVHVIALGVAPDGRAQSLPVKAVAQAKTEQDALDAFEAVAERDEFADVREADPRAALGAVLGLVKSADPLHVVLLGPFRPAPKDLPEPVHAALTRAEERWVEKAAAGGRVFPIDEGEHAWEALEGIAGVTLGALVLACGPAEVSPEPWSPLGDREGAPASEPLTAWIDVPTDVLQTSRLSPVRVVAYTTDRPDDRIRVPSDTGKAELTRDPQQPRTCTLSFAPAKSKYAIVYLCDLPEEQTFAWDVLLPDVRLWNAEGLPVERFEALEAEASDPRSARYRLVRTRTGTAPAWRVRVQGASGAAPPEALRAWVDPEEPTSALLAESAVHVLFAPQPAHPLESRGTIEIFADGFPEPLALAYHVSAGPGRVQLQITNNDVQRLPRAAGDSAATFRVEALNANAPPVIQVLPTSTPLSLMALVRARFVDASGTTRTVSIDEPASLATNTTYALELDLADPERWKELQDGAISFGVADTSGVVAQGEGKILVRARHPRIVLAGHDAPRFVLDDGALRAETPFELELDPDGGDGEWLLARLATAPSIRAPGGGAAPWKVEERGPGRWSVVPAGAWTGGEPDPFDAVVVEEALAVEWPDGETPGTVAVRIDIPARWGMRGWLFVALAAIAVGLGVLAFTQLRPPPVGGTLLYTVEGWRGTVGRLDLRAAGRRPAAIRADERGRLGVGGTGPAIVSIRPTRVGGMLEIPQEDGSVQRRLLVDGLSVRVGRHALRYVSGLPPEGSAATFADEAPDLLGPEFDMDSGRLDAAVDGEGPPDV